MENWKAFTALASFGMALSSGPVLAAEDGSNDLLNLSLAELSNIEVTSVSKKLEKESEAAAAIYVITQDDIRRSGLTNIPELLRMVPGLHVAQSGSHQWSVSSRGFSGQLADTLLVLIDGRTVYTPLFSGVYWDVQDTPLQDIERIEVIRGPGATLWGANAVNGVINIITKSAKDTQGGLVAQSLGTLNLSQSLARYGAKVDDNSFVRLYAKYDDYHAVENMAEKSARDPWNKAQGGFRADWERENHSYTLQGDFYQGGDNFVLNLIQPNASTIPTSIKDKVSGANILGRWKNKISDQSNFTTQIYFDEARRNNIVYYQDIKTFDVDAQHVWSGFDRQEIVWGGAYRLVKSDIVGNPNTAIGVPYVRILPQEQSYNLFSAFVQDKIALVPESVFLTLGSKFEHNDFTGFEYQPSARLSWLVDSKQTLWSSISRAVRTPNIGSTSDLRQVAAPYSAGVFYTQVGNANAKSTEMVAYELGYRIQPEKNISVDVSTFYNDYSRLIIGVAGTPTAYGAYTIIPISPENTGTAHTWGAESTVKWNPMSNVELAASYTLLQMKFDQQDPLGYNFRDKSPQQALNLSATLQLPHDVEFTTAAYFVDRLAAIDINTSDNIDAYTRLDMRLGWNPLDNLELSLVGQNLLDSRHQEYGGFAYQNSSQIPRSVYGNIAWKF